MLEHGPKTMQHENKRKQNDNMKLPQPKYSHFWYKAKHYINNAPN